MKLVVSYLSCILLPLLLPANSYSQGKIFNKVVNNSATAQGQIRGITQDHQGFIWFGVGTASGGIFRYDGNSVINYKNNPQNSNSLSSNYVLDMVSDSSGAIWIATRGGGLERFDPETRTFKHFRHDPKDPFSLDTDTVGALFFDHLGTLWLEGIVGVNSLDPSTNKFKKYLQDQKSPDGSKANFFVYKIYEDSQNKMWFSTIGQGLFMFDRKTGKFTNYTHDNQNPNSIASDSVSAVCEDSKGNFWVGMGGVSTTIFQKLDRKSGTFTSYSDNGNPSTAPYPPRPIKGGFNFITFIHKDAVGSLWIGSNVQGINRYDPTTGMTTHFGVLFNSQLSSDKIYDTLSGFTETGVSSRSVFESKDGLLWIGTASGNLYMVNPFSSAIPYHPIKNTVAVNSFYKDDHKNLWIALNEGLLCKPENGPERKFVFDPADANKNIVNWIIPGPDGNLWMATYSGINIFNPVTHESKYLQHNPTDTNSLSCNYLSCLYMDNEKNVWACSDTGLNKLNTTTGLITRYMHDPADTKSIANNTVYMVTGDDKNLWAGTISGLSRLDKKSGRWSNYLPLAKILSLFIDSKGMLWAGTNDGLYFYSKNGDHFIQYSYLEGSIGIGSVLNIIEDRQNNLWITTPNNLFKINPAKSSLRAYGYESGVHANDLLFVDNYITDNGELIFGDGYGYYAFYPEKVNTKLLTPELYISGFQMGNEEIKPGKGSPIDAPISFAREIRLKHDQNSFSFEFTALHFGIPGDVKYQYQLENYDSSWQNLGIRNRAYFFNVQPGKYVLHVRAIAANGSVANKSINVIISQPWYFTWWGILLQIAGLILLVSVVSYLRLRQLRRQNKILEEKVNHRTRQLHESLTNLKATQSQLIQSEKMASLGELTAGIAHEIQNPLNFVNNFSEVNRELIDEMKEELTAGHPQEAIEIANNIRENEEKIIHHGKRADSIVKGMLQHSRASSGVKEPTDVNALCDEYFRLAYHGLRAKDKSFNATMKMDFDPALSSDELGNGKIKIMQQDVGRVVLNLLTNAFYAVHKKQKELTINSTSHNASAKYEPTVMVSTKKYGDHFEIRVNDNGDGIPKEVLDKIFQPFFTTKPSGEGTGLGLSLSYEIISQGHTGKLQVVTKHDQEVYTFVNGGTKKMSLTDLNGLESIEESGTIFIITLPIK